MRMSCRSGNRFTYWRHFPQYMQIHFILQLQKWALWYFMKFGSKSINKTQTTCSLKFLWEKRTHFKIQLKNSRSKCKWHSNHIKLWCSVELVWEFWNQKYLIRNNSKGQWKMKQNYTDFLEAYHQRMFPINVCIFLWICFTEIWEFYCFKSNDWNQKAKKFRYCQCKGIIKNKTKQITRKTMLLILHLMFFQHSTSENPEPGERRWITSKVKKEEVSEIKRLW